MNSKLVFDGEYIRPATEIPPSLFEINQEYEFEIVDDFIVSNLPEIFQKHGCTDQVRVYEHMYTETAGVGDIDVMDYQGDDLGISSMETILATLYRVIKDYFKGFGPLMKVKLHGQENLNLGYIEKDDETHLIYLELKSHEPGKKAILHLHKSKCPRIYKANRHMLLLKR